MVIKKVDILQPLFEVSEGAIFNRVFVGGVDI